MGPPRPSCLPVTTGACAIKLLCLYSERAWSLPLERSPKLGPHCRLQPLTRVEVTYSGKHASLQPHGKKSFIAQPSGLSKLPNICILNEGRHDIRHNDIQRNDI